MKKITTFSVTAICILLFIACAPVIPLEECATGKIFGFWGGLWHGFITPFSFIISLFKDDVAIYAINNSGTWYDCGFVLGVGILFGGGGRGAKK